MKILTFSDIHSNEIFLEKLDRIIKDEKPDYIVMAGDLTNKEISYAEDFIKIAGKFFGIPGNCDPPQVLEMLEKSGNNLHGKRVESGKYNFVGYGYSPPTPFGTCGERKEEELEEGLKKLNMDKNTILITHAPPYGYFDQIEDFHTGSKAILGILRKKPLIHMFGHIHEHKGFKKIGDTILIKLPAVKENEYTIIEIEDEEKVVNVTFKQI